MPNTSCPGETNTSINPNNYIRRYEEYIDSAMPLKTRIKNVTDEYSDLCNQYNTLLKYVNRNVLPPDEKKQKLQELTRLSERMNLNNSIHIELCKKHRMTV